MPCGSLNGQYARVAERDPSWDHEADRDRDGQGKHDTYQDPKLDEPEWDVPKKERVTEQEFQRCLYCGRSSHSWHICKRLDRDAAHNIRESGFLMDEDPKIPEPEEMVEMQALFIRLCRMTRRNGRPPYEARQKCIYCKAHGHSWVYCERLDTDATRAAHGGGFLKAKHPVIPTPEQIMRMRELAIKLCLLERRFYRTGRRR
ncbi:hypothetical protein PG985_011055 [Apiospora marii]|uniref:Uncharacterized protein n=1 Tax=Apiospora marii TaxID=335849 RepID=A0ABR1SUX5_9PEZI